MRFIEKTGDRHQRRKWLEEKTALEQGHYSGFIIRARSPEGRLMGYLTRGMILWTPWPLDQAWKGHVHRLTVGQIEKALSPQLDQGCKVSLYPAERMNNKTFIAHNAFKLKIRRREIDQ